MEVRPGHAVHLNAERGQAPVVAAVLVERAPSAMERLAVELDGQPRVRPVRVNLMARDEDAGAGSGQAVLEAQFQEAPLRSAAGEGRLISVGSHDAPQPVASPSAA